MIAIGSDHAGYELKEHIKHTLEEMGIEYRDFGAYSLDSVDYPVVAAEVARAVASGEYEKGLLFCGTGVGISMAANKVRGVRAASCSEAFSAEFTRRHNNANILCLGGRVIGPEKADELTRIFLTTPFEGGKHARRVAEIAQIEQEEKQRD